MADVSDERALAPAGAAAPAVIDATTRVEPAIRLHMGDVVFVLDGERLEQMLRAAMPAEIGGAKRAHDPHAGAGLGSLDMVALGLRGAAVAALPVVRKLMAVLAPTYPAPQPPRRSDVLAYLIGYFIRLARDVAERQEWNIAVSETEWGDIELISIAPLRPADAGAASRDAQTSGAESGDDPRRG